MQHLFGTDGIRARVGQSPLRPEDITHIGHAIGQWIIKKFGSPSSILIGCDTRSSCSALVHQLSIILLEYGIDIIDIGIIPTAGLSILLKQDPHTACGIMISASHNPYYDNGIKIIDRTGKISLPDEEYISNLFYAQNQCLTSTQKGRFITNKAMGKKIIEFIVQTRLPLVFNNLKVIVDCAHGSTSLFALALLEALGIKGIALHTSPNGSNINDHCGSLFPAKLQKKVVESGADCGFAFDGDGDRIIAVTKKGVLKNGDDMLALLCHHPHYIAQSPLVGTHMSNEGLADYLKKYNKSLERSAIGDRAVSNLLHHKNLSLGGEPSGHILLHNFLPSSDGLLSMVKILESLVINHNMEMETFAHWPQLLLNVPVKQKKNLETDTIQQVIKEYEKKLESGRILVRYSGTEPLLRIMVESNDKQQVDVISKELAASLQTLLV